MPRPPRPTLFPYTTLFRSVPHDQRKGHVIFDDGIRYDSTVIGGPQVSPTTYQPLVISSPAPTAVGAAGSACYAGSTALNTRSEEHTSELQSRGHLVCRLLL